MNYLAHALLAGGRPASLAGAMLGDFAAGLEWEALPAAVRAAIRHHREVDAFTDSHPLPRRSRARIAPRFRLLRGVMVDVFYDHFLARHWERYGDGGPLPRFTDRVYAALERYDDHLSPRLRAVLPRMRSEDWLASYGDLENVGRALGGMAHRLSRPTPLAQGLAELRAHYDAFEDDFHGFFPELRSSCPPPDCGDA